VFYRYHYGIWPGARYPSQLHYCDGSYTRDDALDAPYSQPVYPAFEFHAPFAEARAVFSPNPKGVHVGDTPICTNLLLVRVGPHRYIPYRLDDPTSG